MRVRNKEALMAALEKAFYVYNNKLPDDEHEIHRSEAAVAALFAVIQYLRTLGFEEKLLEPLKTLYLAVLDVRSGRSNVMLDRIDAGPNRSTKPLEHEIRCADAVSYVELMKTANGPGAVKEAEKDAAKALGLTGEKWLEEFRQKRKNIRSKNGRSISKVGRDHHFHLMEYAKTLSQAQLLALAETLLKQLQDTKT